jgi:hypothetical protein
MPFYLLRSLYKMSKRYKRQKLDSILFHHGLIKLLISHHLKLLNDDWDAFVTRNGFVTINPVETPVVDKPMLEKSLFPSSDSSKACCHDTHVILLVVLLFVYKAHRGVKDWSSTQRMKGQTPKKGTSFLLPPHTLVCIDLKGSQFPC